mgnify:CR=1 FL=1
MFKAGDYLVLLALCALLLAAFLQLGRHAGAASSVIVRQNGTETVRLPLRLNRTDVQLGGNTTALFVSTLGFNAFEESPHAHPSNGRRRRQHRHHKAHQQRYKSTGVHSNPLAQMWAA